MPTCERFSGNVGTVRRRHHQLPIAREDSRPVQQGVDLQNEEG